MTNEQELPAPKEWIELQRAAIGDTSLGTLTLAALAVLPFAHDEIIVSPNTGRPLPVPFGSLMKYANHLLDGGNDPNIRCILYFHFFPNDDDLELLTLPPSAVQISADEIQADHARNLNAPIRANQQRDLNDPEVQRAIAEGRLDMMA